MTTSIRFASKTLYHPETEITLRGKISPVNLTIPSHLQLDTAPTIVKQVWADYLKTVLQELEKAEFIAAHARGQKLHDADNCAVVLQKLLDSLTLDKLAESAPASDKITLTKYKLWLKDVFLPLINKVKQEQGKQVLGKAALKLWFEAFEQGPAMESIYKSKLVDLVKTMAESDSAEVLELLLSDSFETMINFATAAKPEAVKVEFELDI